MTNTKEILSLAVEIADVMLRNGGEIYRIEDTVIHILQAHDIESFDKHLKDTDIQVKYFETHLARICFMSFNDIFLSLPIVSCFRYAAFWIKYGYYFTF